MSGVGRGHGPPGPGTGPACVCQGGVLAGLQTGCAFPWSLHTACKCLARLLLYLLREPRAHQLLPVGGGRGTDRRPSAGRPRGSPPSSPVLCPWGPRGPGCRACHVLGGLRHIPQVKAYLGEGVPALHPTALPALVAAVLLTFCPVTPLIRTPIPAEARPGPWAPSRQRSNRGTGPS